MDTLTLLSFSLSLLLLALWGRAIWFHGYAAYAALHEQIEGGPINPAGLSEFYPRVTVVKLLQKGETAGGLQSFCQQRYPHYQLIFAIETSDTATAQVETIEKLIQQFPDQDIQYSLYSVQPPVSSRIAGLNQALKAAQFDFWVLADCPSMAPDDLHHLVQPFRYASVGAVLSMPSQSTGWLNSWQTMAMAAEFYPELLVARHQNSIYWLPSSVVAIRKAAVIQSGGIEALMAALSDGTGLSKPMASIGYRTASCHLQTQFEPLQIADSIWPTLQQQLNQTRRSHPWKYLLKGTTSGTVASLLLLWLWQGSAWAWLIVALTGLSRWVVMGMVGTGCFKNSAIWRFGVLLPVYDLISLVLWCLGWFGSAPQRQVSLPLQAESFERIEVAETEFLNLLVQPAKVKGT